MKTKLEGEKARGPDEYFGGCPRCGRWDDCLFVGPEDWFVCYRHRTKYLWAANLSSSSGQPASEREQNAATIAGFTEVQPAYPAIPHAVAAALSRLVDGLPGEESVSLDVTTEAASEKARSEAASLVRGWLDARRKAWIQFVEPSDDDEPAAGEADRV